MRRTVYLSGRIGGLTYEEASKARNHAAALLLRTGWDILDPMRGYEILSTLKVIEEGSQVKSMLGVTDAAILQRDKDDVRRADVLLIFSGNQASWGTAFEWELAFELGKPIVVICDEDSPTREHPWCRQMASGFFANVEDAIEFINKWFDRGYRLEEEGCVNAGMGCC